jgi:hypothetical protein
MTPDRDGATFDRTLDAPRLNTQAQRVFDALADGAWRTLREIAAKTGDPEASISARLRDLRKLAFGGHKVDRRRRGDPKAGVWEYRLNLTPTPDPIPE